MRRIATFRYRAGSTSLRHWSICEATQEELAEELRERHKRKEENWHGFSDPMKRTIGVWNKPYGQERVEDVLHELFETFNMARGLHVSHRAIYALSEDLAPLIGLVEQLGRKRT